MTHNENNGFPPPFGSNNQRQRVRDAETESSKNPKKSTIHPFGSNNHSCHIQWLLDECRLKQSEQHSGDQEDQVKQRG